MVEYVSDEAVEIAGCRAERIYPYEMVESLYRDQTNFRNEWRRTHSR